MLSPDGARLFLCGDVMTGRGVDQIMAHPSGPRIFESYVHDAREYVRMAESVNGPIPRAVPPSYIWGDALEEFERMAPLARVVNLETSVTRSDDYWKDKGINYRMHPGNVDCLAAARIDVCALANNHVLDFGRAGLVETLETLDRAGVKTAGAGQTLAQALAPAIVQPPDGPRIIVFSLGTESSGILSSWNAGAELPGVALLPDLSQQTAAELVARAQQVRQPNDIVLASIHWGTNWGYEVPREHVLFAHWLVDGGIDIVHGHSSHHPRPIEVFRKRLILYGCGDFIHDYEGISGHEQYRNEIAVMYFPAVTAGGELIGLDMTPMRIAKLRLTKTSAAEARWLQDSLEAASSSFGSRIDRLSDGTLTLRWS